MSDGQWDGQGYPSPTQVALMMERVAAGAVVSKH